MLSDRGKGLNFSYSRGCVGSISRLSLYINYFNASIKTTMATDILRFDQYSRIVWQLAHCELRKLSSSTIL